MLTDSMERMGEEVVIPPHIQCITDIKRSISKYEGFDIEVEYVTLDNILTILNNEDDILGKLEENEGSVVYCVFNNEHGLYFAHTNPSIIYNFIYHFRAWSPCMTVVECKNFEDAYTYFST